MKNYKQQVLREIGRTLYLLLTQMPRIRNKITKSDIFGVNKEWKKFTTRFNFLASKFYSISTKIEDDNQHISVEISITPTIDWDVFSEFYKTIILNTGNITVMKLKEEYLKDILNYFARPTFNEEKITDGENVSFTIKYENENENLERSDKLFKELFEFTKEQKKERAGLIRIKRRYYYKKRKEKTQDEQ